MNVPRTEGRDRADALCRRASRAAKEVVVQAVMLEAIGVRFFSQK